MRLRKAGGIAAVALLMLPFAWTAPSHAQDAAGSELAEEYARQEDIYRSRGREIPRGYVLDRTLELYAEILPEDFGSELAGLGPEDRWLDVGAGQGRAVLDYYSPRYDKARRKQRGRKARAVAMSIEDRRTPEWRNAAAAPGGERMQYLHGKRLREYSPEELGRFDLITDVMGGFAYTPDLSRFMENVMKLLEVDGSFLTVLQDVELERGTNKPFYDGYPYTTEIENPGGSKTTICSWLKSFTCAEVRCESRENWSQPLEAYHVRKVCDDVSIPALVPVTFSAGTPPQRGYRLDGPPRRPAAKPAR